MAKKKSKACEGIVIYMTDTRYAVAVTKFGRSYVPVKRSFTSHIELADKDKKWKNVSPNPVVDIGSRIEFTFDLA